MRSQAETLPANARPRLECAVRWAGFTLAVAICTWGSSDDAQAREIDNRPLFYAMLQALETNFEPYLQYLVTEHGNRLSALDNSARRDLAELEKSRHKLNTERARAFADLAKDRDRLNQRTKRLNEVLATSDEQAQRRAEGQPLARLIRKATDGQEKALAGIRAMQSQYRNQAVAANAASRTYARGAEHYQDGNAGGLAEIARIRNEFNLRADQANSELATLAKADTQAQSAYLNWVSHQNTALEQVAERNKRLRERFEQVRIHHDDLAKSLQSDIERYNALAEQLNAGEIEDEARKRALAEIDTLEPVMTGAKAELDKTRQQANELAGQFGAGQADLNERIVALRAEQAARRDRFEVQRQSRAARRKAIEAELRGDRRSTMTRIDALKTDARTELARLEQARNAALRALEAIYGVSHREIHMALARWLDGGPVEPVTALLDEMATGEAGPEAQLGRLQNLVAGAQAAGKTLSDLLIQLEELVENDRRLKSRWPGIDAERRAIETDRQMLAKANRELHQAVFTAGDALKAEIAARKTLHRRQSAALAMVFQVARTLGKLEFELLQSVLLQHLGTDATTIDSRAWAGLEGQISEAAAALPTQFAETKTLSLGSFLSARAGPVGQPWTTAWERYSYQPISSSESLAVQARRALAQTLWTLHLDKRGPLRAIQADIAATPLGNDKRPPNPLQGLLLVALQNFAELSLHQLDNGRAAISLDVLKQSRWLTPDGQFEYLPDS